MRSAALLPTGKTMNPRRPESAHYYDPSQTAIVVDVGGGRLRCLTSFGDLDDWAIDSRHEIHHDQTLRRLGNGKVVGKVTFADGVPHGNVPNRALPHWVFK
ncbi:MAG: hypothetical protein KGK07_15135 [Chloroflexota bacterium]|nr:hypothetical protein [Chloroflexota bacterium]